MKHQSFKLCLLIGVMMAVSVVFGSITVFASDVSGTCGGNLEWTFDVDTETLTVSGTGDMQNYSNTNKAPWDQYRNKIKQVVINDGVASLGAFAFSDCEQFISVSIPNSVTSIGNHTFFGCSALTEISLPFAGESLRGTKNTYFGYIFGAPSYEGNQKYIPTSLKRVTITKATRIQPNAFAGCGGLTSVILSDNVTGIGSGAFSDCTGLTSMIIPNRVKTIGASSFLNCTGLTSVTIGGGVTNIFGSAFSGCTALTDVTIPGSVKTIGAFAFRNCTGLKRLCLTMVWARSAAMHSPIVSVLPPLPFRTVLWASENSLFPVAKG